ncbi:unnamed protein product [Effrenium voratum]|uniref:non-specific serine/threonine protein kinase n=1 Tax=Effrenium voratum TaxID=2562239 RepID=A0AA36IES4_9DINO|nr:unnamed protein product [Effrenium voratum]
MKSALKARAPLRAPVLSALTGLMPRKASPKAAKAETLDAELKRHLEEVGALTGELDLLFAEMGRQPSVIKAGQRYECRIAAGMTRTLDVRLPQHGDAGDFVVQVSCRLNEDKHITDNEEQPSGKLPPEPFALGICDTARQAAEESPLREFRAPAIAQSLSFTTDFSGFFVVLTAKTDCHVVFMSKASAKGFVPPKLRVHYSTGTDSDSELEACPTRAMKKLMKKVKQYKKTKFVERKSPGRVHKALAARRDVKKGVSFGELVFPEGRPVKEQHQIEYAQMKILQLWLGRRRMERKRRPSWAKKLSADFPHKLAHYLVKTRQEQSMLTSIAIAGGFAFFLQRQRELHLMRCRRALRQVAWYKALFTSSHLLIFAVFMMKGRQAKRSPSTAVPSSSSRRLSLRRRSSEQLDLFFQEANPLLMVRKYLRGSRGISRGGSMRPSDGGASPSPKTGSPQASPKASQSLEQHLAQQGFCLYPAFPEKNTRTLQRNQLAKGLAARLGRQTTRAPQVVSNLAQSGPQDEMQQAIQEISQSTLMMTISPREALVAKGEAEVELMGAEHFQAFYLQRVQSAADQLLKQRAREAEVKVVRAEVKLKVKIVKRYLLRFFEPDLPDHAWLSLQQSLMLVIRGKSSYLTPSEQMLLDDKLKNVNEERRAATTLPGLFAPLEAVLLCHPVIVGVTSRLQKELAKVDSVVSWKTTLFEGRCEKISGRDLEGHQFLPSDGRASEMLRRCVNVGGPFNGSTAIVYEDFPPASRESFSAATGSGGSWRSFGSRPPEGLDTARWRPEDPAKQLPPLTEPRDLWLEDACRDRRAQTAASVASRWGERTAEMVADGEARSQQRYRSWAMSSLVPQEAREWKAKVLPFFEDFASSCDAITSKVSGSLSASPRLEELTLRPSQLELMLPEGWPSSQGFAPSEGRSSEKEGDSASPAWPPTTPQQVGQWLAQHDALQSVQSDDVKPTCACGWKSGFRKDPMSMAEVQRVRILERSNANFAKRRSGVGDKRVPEAQGQLVALKRARVGQLSEVASDKAQEEAQLLMRLSQECPHILQCFDFRLASTTLPVLELLLEFAPLGDLSGRIRQHKEWCHSATQEVVGMPEPELVSYGCDIATGLAYLHGLRPKILHRDIKPANILLFADEALIFPRAKLGDFGIVIGTPHYFAPELCRGEQYDERADSWALGCILYEMLCLHRPFHQVEGNLALLAVRISEGKLDRAALEKQAELYNGRLILVLTGLLCPTVEQRSRAGEVLESLQHLQAKHDTTSLPAPTAWWRTQRLEESWGLENEEMLDEEWEAPDSWREATLAQLEGLLSQLPELRSPHKAEVTLGVSQLEACWLPGEGEPVTARTDRTLPPSPALSPQGRCFGSEPGTEYLGESPGLCASPPAASRAAWAETEAPTFGEPVAPSAETPLRQTATRLFFRPVRQGSYLEPPCAPAPRPHTGKWLFSELSEDEVIFCFAPSGTPLEKAGMGTQPPPPSPTAEPAMDGWQEVEVASATLPPQDTAWRSGIFVVRKVLLSRHANDVALALLHGRSK